MSQISLRRSVWGSLRSVSPFPPSHSQHEGNSETEVEMRSFSRSMQSMHFGRSQRANSALKQSTNQTPKTITMTAFDAEGRPPPPELDREVDLAGSLRFDDEEEKPYSVFELLRPQQVPNGISFFSLPPKIKHNVYGFCFSKVHNKITLSPRFATKAIFDDEYFTSPWDILDPIWSGLSASPEMRQELLTYFWTEYRFHVSVNPFSGPRFSPLSQIWLPQHLGIIRYLTIEIDLTRFGGSALKYASTIGFECGKLERLVVNLLEGLQKRSTGVKIAELVLLARRYLGNRPVDGVYVTNDEIPWHPNEFSFMSDAVAGLHGVLEKCRICGFPLDYTQKLLQSLFDELDEPKDSAWPALPIYEPPVRAPSSLNAHSLVSESYAQFGTSFATTTRRSTYGTDNQPDTTQRRYMPTIKSIPMLNVDTALQSSIWDLPLHRSDSLVEMFEDGINESQESLTSNYTTDNSIDHSEKHMVAFSDLKDSDQYIFDRAQSYQSLLPPVADSTVSTARNSPRTATEDRYSVQPSTEGILRRHSDASPVRNRQRNLISSNAPISTPRSRKSPRVRASPPPSAEQSAPTPLPPSRLSPSMSVMNALNEQDPAFIRTMEALRPREEPVLFSVEKSQTTFAERPSFVERGDSPMSSLSNLGVGEVKKRYMSFAFFNRLKGHGSG